MAVSISLKSRIVAAMMTGSIIGITVIVALWIFNQQLVETRTAKNAVITKQQLIEDALVGQINSLIAISDTVVHSLSLRHKIIDLNQMVMNLPQQERQQFLEDRIKDHEQRESLIETDRGVVDSTEADYLRSIVQSSNGVIDRILVTDAFGFVQIASHTPEESHVFFNDWWQSTLRFGQNQIYNFADFDENLGGLLYLNRPLFNDDLTNAVGILQIRINLRSFFRSQQQTLNTGEAQTIVVTEKNQIFPPNYRSGPYTIGELLTFTQKRSDLFLDEKNHVFLRIDSLDGAIVSFIPGLSWSLITYHESPDIFTFSHPTFRKAFLIWLIGIFVFSMLCYLISLWVDAPLQTVATALNQIVSGNYRIRLPEDNHSGVNELSIIVNQLAATLEESTTEAQRSLRENSASISAFEDFTQEAALEHDRKVIADSLLRLSVRKSRAEAGILMIHNHDYQTPMTLKYNLSDDQIQRYTSISLHGVHSKKLFFSWDNPEHQAIWDDGFQVVMATPVRTRHTRYGTIYLLFDTAISKVAEKDRTVELLALQAAVYSSRSGLYHQLNRQVSFNEGILSGIPWFICTLDSEYRITWHNQQLQSIGLKSDLDVINSLCCRTFKGRESKCPDCPAKKTLQDGKSHNITQRWIVSENETLWIRVSSFPFMDKTGKMSSVILFIQNITSETRTQSELKQLSHAIESIGEAVVLTEMSGKIAFINKSFQRIFEYSKAEIINHSLEMLFPMEKMDIYYKIRTALNKDSVWNQEIELLTRSQKLIPVYGTASLVRDDAGIPIGQVVTFFDISSQQESKNQLMLQFKELEILQKISSMLTENHQLRDLMQLVLEELTEFTKCGSGAILLFDTSENELEPVGRLFFDKRKPTIFAEAKLPGYFIKYTSEIRQGQEFELFSQLCSVNYPVVHNQLKQNSSVDARLLIRMGFQSLLAIPLVSANEPIGLIILFSKQAAHFESLKHEVFKALASQIAQSIYGRYLQERFVKDAGLLLTSQLVNQIGGDVIKLGTALDQSRMSIESTLNDNSFLSGNDSWSNISRIIWHLQQVARSIPALGTQDQKLFFPEDLNVLIQRIIDQIQSHHFYKQIQLHFNPDPDIQEVYINKHVISQAITNLLALIFESFWNTPSPRITIKVLNTFGSPNYYAIDFEYNFLGPVAFENAIAKFINGGVTDETSVLLARISQCVEIHGGKLVLPKHSTSAGCVRLLLAKHPDKN